MCLCVRWKLKEKRLRDKMELNCSFGKSLRLTSGSWLKIWIFALSPHERNLDEKEKLIKMALFALHCASLSLFNYFIDVFLQSILILLLRDFLNWNSSKCNLSTTLEFTEDCMQNIFKSYSTNSNNFVIIKAFTDVINSELSFLLQQ